MSTSRQKILSHLKKNRSASAREIARALKLSTPNVRHHLSVLCADGRVEMKESRPRNGRGRPEKTYALPQVALGDNLSALANAFLDEAGAKVKMEAVASRILSREQFSNLPMAKRLALLVEKLNEMHYQAKWEAGAEGPRIVLGRCPYWAIIENHPELCSMDAAMIKGALARPVFLMQKMETKTQALCPFIFNVG
jgi:predicted ArsR family transcriptional regulator